MSYQIIEITITPEFWNDMNILPHLLKDCERKLPGFDGYLIGDDLYSKMEQYKIVVVKGRPDGFFVHVRDDEDKIADRVKRFIKLNRHAKFVGQKAGWINEDFMNNKITVKLDFEWIK